MVSAEIQQKRHANRVWKGLTAENVGEGEQKNNWKNEELIDN